MSTINQRLAHLREKLEADNISAIVIPSSDAHQSEYAPPHWLGREWISGFNGSAGTVAITMDHAGLWTDSRYFLQAEEQLADSEFELHKMINQFSAGEVTWLAEHLPAGATVAIDGFAFSQGQLRKMQAAFAAQDITVAYTKDYLDPIWPDRPALPMQPIFEHDATFTGATRSKRIAEVRAKIKAAQATHHIITTLDDIGWLLNLRGSDVTYNPVFLAYMLISPERLTLFCDASKIDDSLQATLAADGIDLAPYDAVLDAARSLDSDATILVDPSTCNCILYEAIAAEIVEGEMPSRHLKAVKNETEIAHTQETMIHDGVALAKTFYWMRQSLKEGSITELELSDKLAEMRSQQPHYRGESFGAIVGYRGNGAIIHYRPVAGQCADIHPEGMLLVDSGGQYLNGTTDITRTFALSEPTDQQRRHYTLVLKGMIALTLAKFPEGTNGQQLDTLARMYLWSEGLNYGHGTGHGVGYFMNVHEPPQGFSPTSSSRGSTVHVPGMITSNEPGYYLEGQYGIRIENLVVTRKAAEKGFLEHETLTLYPLELALIEETLISSREKAWINKYQHRCLEAIAPHLSDAEREWFELECKTLN